MCHLSCATFRESRDKIISLFPGNPEQLFSFCLSWNSIQTGNIMHYLEMLFSKGPLWFGRSQKTKKKHETKYLAPYKVEEASPHCSKYRVYTYGCIVLLEHS